MLAERIANFKSTDNPIQRPYLIAEAGVNHEGSLDLAQRQIEEAQKGGAHAIKFQTYKAETLASKDSPSYWDLSKEPTTSQFELFKKHDSFWKSEFEKLKVLCDKNGIEFLSTPFDVESADFLNDLMPVYKISSSDLSNFPFIEYMAKKNKPIILSTGASHLWEVFEVVELLEKHKNPLCLMHCILNYPTKDENAHLGMIVDLKKRFPDHIMGYSDHTLPGDMQNLLTANLLGAQILEKHFTHDKNLPGNDHYHAMDWKDIQVFQEKVNQTHVSLGSFEKDTLASEAISRQNARRSLVTARDIQKGKVITKEDLTWKRPASGVSPKYINDIIGKVATDDISEDTVLKYNMIAQND